MSYTQKYMVTSPACVGSGDVSEAIRAHLTRGASASDWREDLTVERVSCEPNPEEVQVNYHEEIQVPSGETQAPSGPVHTDEEVRRATFEYPDGCYDAKCSFLQSMNINPNGPGNPEFGCVGPAEEGDFKVSFTVRSEDLVDPSDFRRGTRRAVMAGLTHAFESAGKYAISNIEVERG